MLHCQDTTGKLARWNVDLYPYDFKVHFRPGVELQDADALTRLPTDKELRDAAPNPNQIRPMAAVLRAVWPVPADLVQTTFTDQNQPTVGTSLTSLPLRRVAAVRPLVLSSSSSPPSTTGLPSHDPDDSEGESEEEEELEEEVEDLSDWQIGTAYAWLANNPDATEEEKMANLNHYRKILYASPGASGGLGQLGRLGTTLSSAPLWSTTASLSTWWDPSGTGSG
ncbi:hypothetical protein WJX74_003685 [Apatococcus lobatus]|uniref:Uncharacterized protein n=1 Tax=Apatococcus lobatus TaxID=904363 RepID=A0AAW1RIX9_9CHLO